MPKTEAQIKNEEEVRRIMEERGYSSASSKKKVKKTFGNSFPFRPFIVGFLVIGFFVGGGILLQNKTFEDEQDDNSIEEATSLKKNEELAEFQTCLRDIDASEIALDDVEFWNKHISRYEQMLSCYDDYPSVADPSEKTDLQNKLAEFQNNLESAEANDAAYRANMAQIDAELERNLAKIKEESDAWDAELLRRVQERQAQSDERSAQYAKEQAEREAKQAKCDAFKAQYPDVDTYKEKNGNLDELWNAYQDAKSKYNSALNSYGQSNPNHSDEWREAVWKGVKEKEATMNAAYDAWNSSNTTLSNGYNNGFREACL